MMTRALRRSVERQEGQALVLACVLMLLLSIALITTVNIGHGVHERIRLQNTADAAAWSTAAMEARAFNFYAFTNRTQVSHYVSAMMWQSLDSFLFSVQAFLTDIYGFMRTIGPCFPSDSRDGVFWMGVCTLLDNLPTIGAIMKGLDLVYTVLRGMLLLMKPVMEPIDQVIGRVVVPGHRMLNAVMAGAATTVMLATTTYVTGTSHAIIEANDPDVDPLVPQTLAGLINQCLYSRTHYKEANGTPFSPVNPFEPLDPTKRNETDKVARAKRVMAGITNATRFACDAKDGACPEALVTDRRLGSLMPIPHWLEPLEAVLDSIPKWGQTRFLSYRLGDGGMEASNGKSSRGRNKIRESRDLPNLPMGMLAQGDILGADDPYFIKFPGPASVDLGGTGLLNPFRCPKEPGVKDKRTWRDCWGDPREDKNDTLETSVWAMSSTDLRENGIHWRVVFPGEASRQEDRDVGLYESRPCLASVQGACFFEMSVYVANVRIDPKDHNHPWPGLAPFPHFEPGDYAKDCAESVNETPGIAAMAQRQEDFNQPSTWVLLHKSADAFHDTPGQLNSSGKLTFAFGTTPETLDLKNGRKALEIGGFTGTPGMSVISRGQTYYHRPGNWTEQPNFFNPYWRPRLAAVWQGKDSLPLVGKMADALPGALGETPTKFITH
ncbi:pilus assembly protein TadG-related protein [Archangium sp.]|uniref:pilus assembly protein TadG-related protein n=1 Tax=Archangium sp. TaxID=1872627 RepID=UPI002D29597E|nr:pilus assembly protein TadG-related protein [Archangium sp.]HYO56747.1 pilus assembly protein TadG-related protein [Archangium sp.]